MANTQKANPADRFRIPESVAKWHLTRRIVRSRRPRPDTGEIADDIVQAFRLYVSKPPAGEKSKSSPGGKTAP